jgi:hypothetical protein
VSLDNLILERLRRLPVESQRLIEIIAVAGDPLPQKALADAAGVPLGSEGWERGISALAQARLIRRSGGQGSDVVEPYHDRIGEAVLGSLDPAALRRLRTGIAHAMEKWGRERTDLLARYWLEADDRRARQVLRARGGHPGAHQAGLRSRRAAVPDRGGAGVEPGSQARASAGAG